nr:PREDICTED: insulin-like growth factor-binding protein 6 [Anolis carolinensis]|eukprot:XP_008113303.2 PREDICTED: insulin-like growth factor-binding protein 6 [Anolis carolinensis]
MRSLLFLLLLPLASTAACPLLARGSGCKAPSSSSSSSSCAEAKGCVGLARAPGEACGVYTPGCAPGLRCVPRPGERTPLHALLRGRGLCLEGTAAAPRRNRTQEQQQQQEPHAGENHGASHFTPEPLRLQSQDPLQEAPVGKAQLEQLSINSDAKEDLDTAPCRMHLAAILQELKAPLYLNGEDIFIPNCDTKGFYRRKQCLASRGQKRGQCWCVDKRGRRLEGQDENPLCLLANSD